AGRPGVRQGVVVHEVLAGVHADDAGHPLGARCVDRADVGVGVRAAKDGRVDHARQLDVVDVVALAPDEARVFLSLDGSSEDIDSHLDRLPQPAAPAEALVPVSLAAVAVAPRLAVAPRSAVAPSCFIGPAYRMPETMF